MESGLKGFTCDLSMLHQHLDLRGEHDAETVSDLLRAIIETAGFASNYVSDMVSTYRPCAVGDMGERHKHTEFYEAAVTGIGMWLAMIEKLEVLNSDQIARAFELAKLITIEKRMDSKGASA